MVRKVFSMILLLLVFVNFTGIPVMLHYCSMNGGYSRQVCTMCTTTHEKAEPSCCDEETVDWPVAFTGDQHCCKESLLAAPSGMAAELAASLTVHVNTHQLTEQYVVSYNLPESKPDMVVVYEQLFPPGYTSLDIPILNSTFRI